MTKITRHRVDQLNEQRLALVHPYVAEKAASFMGMCEHHLDIVVFIIAGIRTFEEQDALYAQGRTKPGAIVTWVKGGGSYHNYGLAVDHWPLMRISEKTFELEWKSTDFINTAFKKTRELAKDVGFELLRADKDRPHLQYRGGWNKQSLKAAGYGQALPIDDIPLS